MASCRIPGPQCAFTQPTAIDDGTSPLCRVLPPGPLCGDLLSGRVSLLALQLPAAALAAAGAGAGAGAAAAAAATVGASASPAGTPAVPAPPLTTLDNDTRMLAATAYGEGSSKNVFEEMAAIANVLVRQRQARGYTSDAAFIQADKTFAFAAHDGNERYARLMAASIADINADAGMLAAVRGAINARSDAPVDYANGAYFWDGADIKTNYDKHAKVLAGIQITDPKHNIYAIKSKSVPGENWWDKDKRKSRGKWTYTYDSTAAWGGTIFWKYNADFLKSSGNKAYK